MILITLHFTPQINKSFLRKFRNVTFKKKARDTPKNRSIYSQNPYRDLEGGNVKVYSKVKRVSIEHDDHQTSNH
jgi:hypothetical protein